MPKLSKPICKSIITLSICMSVFFQSTTVFSAPINNFSVATINIPINGIPTYINNGNTTGTPSSIAEQGIDVSPFLISVYAANAAANLSSGQLKAASTIMQLPGQYFDVVNNQGPGVISGGARASSSFGDSFRTFAGNSPFAWGQDSVNFHAEISGFIDNGGLYIPDVNPYENTGVPFNGIFASLYFEAYRPGALDTAYRFSSGDYNNDDFINILNYLDENLIYVNSVVLTPEMWGFDYGNNIILVFPGSFDFSFAPMGDFDWVIGLNVDITLDHTTLAVMPTVDFSNTINISYSGPTGATTYSGSGVFPNTLPFSATSIPEPSNIFLPALIVLFIYQQRRWRMPLATIVV